MSYPVRSTLVLVFFSLVLAGCARSCVGCKRSTQTGAREYHIRQYSGGQVVGEYRFHGIVNNAESSDGYYWYQGDTLIEISGDVEIRSWKRQK